MTVPTDDEGRALLLCSECEKPVFFDPDAERHHRCSCGDPPSGYTIPSRSALLDHLSAFDPESTTDAEE